LVKGVIEHAQEIDEIITKSAPERPLNQINIVDRNILRMGLYEVLLEKADDVPVKVAINEAVELAKNYGGDKSYSFVNGVLGTVFRTIEGINEEVKEVASEVLEEVKEELIPEASEEVKVFEEKE
jgi:N utilization substance protein B